MLIKPTELIEVKASTLDDFDFSEPNVLPNELDNIRLSSTIMFYDWDYWRRFVWDYMKDTQTAVSDWTLIRANTNDLSEYYLILGTVSLDVTDIDMTINNASKIFKLPIYTDYGSNQIEEMTTPLTMLNYGNLNVKFTTQTNLSITYNSQSHTLYSNQHDYLSFYKEQLANIPYFMTNYYSSNSNVVPYYFYSKNYKNYLDLNGIYDITYSSLRMYLNSSSFFKKISDYRGEELHNYISIENTAYKGYLPLKWINDNENLSNYFTLTDDEFNYVTIINPSTNTSLEDTITITVKGLQRINFFYPDAPEDDLLGSYVGVTSVTGEYQYDIEDTLWDTIIESGTFGDSSSTTSPTNSWFVGTETLDIYPVNIDAGLEPSITLVIPKFIDYVVYTLASDIETGDDKILVVEEPSNITALPDNVRESDYIGEYVTETVPYDHVIVLLPNAGQNIVFEVQQSWDVRQYEITGKEINEQHIAFGAVELFEVLELEPYRDSNYIVMEPAMLSRKIRIYTDTLASYEIRSKVDDSSIVHPFDPDSPIENPDVGSTTGDSNFIDVSEFDSESIFGKAIGLLWGVVTMSGAFISAFAPFFSFLPDDLLGLITIGVTFGIFVGLARR